MFIISGLHYLRNILPCPLKNIILPSRMVLQKPGDVIDIAISDDPAVFGGAMLFNVFQGIELETRLAASGGHGRGEVKVWNGSDHSLYGCAPNC